MTDESRSAADLSHLAVALGIGRETAWVPDHLPTSAWLRHIPFAFWITKALRPRTLVELGTHSGGSYAAFCQAVDRLGLSTRCYAVDTWTGDHQSAHYGPEVYDQVNGYNAARYLHFSTLLRSQFDDARPFFNDGEVDLLHIDGLHTYEAVSHDFETWLSSLSDRGIVLFHDTNVRRDDFGVWRFWHELQQRYPSFEFVHGHGLGVLAVGKSIPSPLARLFETQDDDFIAAVRAYFAAAGEAVQIRFEWQETQRREAALFARANALQGELDRRNDDVLAAQQQLTSSQALAAELQVKLDGTAAEAKAQAADAKARAAALRAQAEAAAALASAAQRDLADTRQRLRQVQAVAEDTRQENVRLGAELAALAAAAHSANLQLAAIAGSTAWKATYPVRRMFTRLPALRWLIRNTLVLAWRVVRPRRRPRNRVASPAPAPPADPAPQPAAPQPADPQPAAPAYDLTKAPAALRGTGAPPPRSEPVDIIVCIHNALDDVRVCLASILACTIPPFNLILVDDGSDAPTRDYLAAFARDNAATLLRNDTAGGYTRAANMGLRAAAAPYAILLNSDTEVTFRWTDRMVAHAKRDPRVGLVGPLSNTASWQSVPAVFDGDTWASNPLPAGLDLDAMARIVARTSAQQGIPLPFLNGFCLLLRRDLIEQIGLFDEEVFGAGYGEENDYCIRARKAGWHLVVADDCYVAHRESRSYSHERRAILSKAADAALVKKHDPQTHIWPQVGVCKSGLGIVGVRARIAAGLQRDALIRDGRARYEGKRVAIILPCASEGGGANVVLQEARALRRMGVDVSIINFATHREGFDRAYPDHGLPVVYVDAEDDIAGVLSDPGCAFHAAVATLYRSVFWLPQSPGPLILGYYVQDFEPGFFDESDPEHRKALDSYRARDDIRLFCKTEWNAAAVRQATGRDLACIGPSVDIDMFRPGPGRAEMDDAQQLQILALVRPSTPRRGAAATVRLLDRLHQTFGGTVTISVFGSADAELAQAGLQRPHINNLGPLRREQVAFQFERGDMFLDCSVFQAMGLTALEAMASGCAVVVPVNGGCSSFAQNDSNALLVDTADEEACFRAAARLVTDHALRRAIRQNAADTVCQHTPERAGLRMMDALFAGGGR